MHTPRLSRRGLVLAAVAVVAWIGAPLVAAQDLDAVREEVATLEDRVRSSTAAYEDAWARAEEARTELAAIEVRGEALAEEAEDARQLLLHRARRVYMRGAHSTLTLLFSAGGPDGVAERAGLVAMLTSRDRTRLETLRALRRQLHQTRLLQADEAAELAALEAEMEEHVADLGGDLEAARVLLADLETRAARRREISRGDQQGTYACIFDRPFTFRDTWGAPRSGGRRHKGTDVYSYHGAPVYAFTSGRIQRTSNSGLGGIGLYLAGDDGNLYYHAHLDRIADGVQVGQRVEAGELVAHNGDSGNARGGPSHVHYQMHPGGGAPVNPYPWLAAACF